MIRWLVTAGLVLAAARDLAAFAAASWPWLVGAAAAFALALVRARARGRAGATVGNGWAT